MSYELGISSKCNLKAIQKIAEKDLQEYHKAADFLTGFSTDRHLFSITILNYNEFLDTVIDLSDFYSKNPSMASSPNMENMFMNINRLVINYLFSVRTFLEHTEFKLKTTYGKGGSRTVSFKKTVSDEYDNNFSYRFLYKLRNYCQHCGMPVDSFSLQSKEDPPLSGKRVSSLSIKFKRDVLLQYDGWGNQVREELKMLRPEFGVIPHIASLKSSLDRISVALIKDNISELSQSAEYIEKLISPAIGKEGTPVIFSIVDQGKEKKIQIINIPFHLIDYVRQLKEMIAKEE